MHGAAKPAPHSAAARQAEPSSLLASNFLLLRWPLGYCAAFSSARAALRIFMRPRFPSWHEYSKTAPLSSRVNGIENVQGLVQVAGSSTVTDHFTTSGAVRVTRSVKRNVAGFALR